jgi:hypothetical protein
MYTFKQVRFGCKESAEEERGVEDKGGGGGWK